MPKIQNTTPAELLFGDSQNVMMRGVRKDSRVVLSSKNLFGNNDLSDFDDNGNIEDITLKAPARSDGWYPYVRQQTRIASNGTHVVLRNTRQARQETSAFPFHHTWFNLYEAVVPGSPLPALNKRAKVAPPDEAPRVKVRTRSAGVGYRAGIRWISYAWILGDHVHVSPRITPAAPPIQVTLLQGQKLTVYLPQQIPPGVTGIAILLSGAGQDATGMRVQKIVDVSHSIPATIPLRGPYRFTDAISITSPNNSQVSNIVSSAAARHRLVPHPGNLMPMTTRLAYIYRTDQGLSPVLGLTDPISYDRVAADIQNNEPGTTKKDAKKPSRPRWAIKGHALQWWPQNPPPGVLEWIPVFLGNDGQYYSVPNGDGGGGWPLSKPAYIVSNDPQAPHSWPAGLLPQSAPDTPGSGNPDATGIDPPSSPLDPPDPIGAVELQPGNYACRTTFSSLGEESAPSDATVVTLRDAGLAAGGAATGTTDQMLSILHPSVQKIDNSRFDSKDAAGEVDLDWTTPTVPGTVVTTGNGVMTVDDTSGARTSDVVRLKDPFPVNPARMYTVRMKLALTRLGGSFDAFLRFFNSSGVQVGSDALLDRISTIDSLFVSRTIGPATTPTNINFPAGTATMQLLFRSNGAATARQLRAVVTHLGIWYGRATNHKRYPLDFGLYATGSERRRAPAVEDDAKPYPPGAFCHIVENPDDGARYHNPTILDAQDFGSGANPPAGLTKVLTGSSTLAMNVTQEAAVSGDYGLRIVDDTGGVASQAYFRDARWASTTRSSISCYFTILERTLPASGGSGVARITRDLTDGNKLAEVRIDAAGIVSLLAYNGSVDTSQTAGNIPAGSSIRGDLQCFGVGTANGRAVLRLWANDRFIGQTTLASLNWTGFQVGHVLYGAINIPANAVFRRLFDKVWITADGLNDTDPIPGNYAEYWAPEGQPYIQDGLATEAPTPVDPNTDYVFSAYCGTEGVQKACSLLKTAFKDNQGNVLKNNGYLVTLKGTHYWDRYSIVLHSPPNAAYLEITGNNVADGLIRAMGFQDEKGLILTPFTNQNASSGYATLSLDTNTPGTEDFIYFDTAEWIAARTVHHDEEDVSGNPLTSTTLQLRTSDTFPIPSTATWYPNLYQLIQSGVKRYVDLRANLSTTNLTLSPELRGMFLELERTESIFLTGDGAEFMGGAQALNFPVPVPGDTLIYPVYADGSTGKENYHRGHPPDTVTGFTIQCFRKQTVDDIMSRRAKGESFVVEAWGQRYHIDITSALQFPINGREHLGAGDDPNDGYWLFATTVGTAKVIRQVDI